MKAVVAGRRGAIALASLFVASLMLVMYVAPPAGADHEPANKVAAAGSETIISGPGEEVTILSERVRVSSGSDLILALTAECDILTELTTGGNGQTDSAGAMGSIEAWIEIDGTRVKVSSDDSTNPGEVVLCNRAHNKSIKDAESNTPMDGTDEETDETQTRQANAFNWLALDTGFLYDDKVTVNGNNILDIVVKARLTETVTNGRAEVEALIGHRTLIVEPTNVSVHEAVQAEGGDGN